MDTNPDTLVGVAGLLRRLALRQKLVVNLREAAWLLNTSEDKMRDLVRAGLVATVPPLSSTAKFAISIAELDRFTAGGVTVASRLQSAS